MLTHFQNTSGVIKHFSNGEIEAIQLGAGCLAKRVENIHGVEVLSVERQPFVQAIDGIPTLQLFAVSTHDLFPINFLHCAAELHANPPARN